MSIMSLFCLVKERVTMGIGKIFSFILLMSGALEDELP